MHYTCLSAQRILAFGLALGCVFFGERALSSATDPTLLLTRASVQVGSGSRSITLEGSFQSNDLVQLAYPIQVLVWSDSGSYPYVRFDLPTGALTGDAPELSDGLDAAEAAALLGTGTASSEGGVSFVGARRMDLLLPGSLPAGPGWAQLFVLDGVDIILSNPLSVEIGAAQ